MRILPRNKKGQVIDTAGGTVISIFILIVLIFVALYAVATLNPSSFFTSGSASANATTNLQSNLTEGASQFGGYFPTIMKVLAVVIVLAAILLLILYVYRMKQASGGSSDGL